MSETGSVRQGMAIEWTARAIRDMRRIDRTDRDRIIAKIEQYARDPATQRWQVVSLTGSDYLRLRAGSHRILFVVERGEREVMVVLRVRHRREAYGQ